MNTPRRSFLLLFVLLLAVTPAPSWAQSPGGKAHRAKIDEIMLYLREIGCTHLRSYATTPKKERPFVTNSPVADRALRWADASCELDGKVKIVNVGRTTPNGMAIARERIAAFDVMMEYPDVDFRFAPYDGKDDGSWKGKDGTANRARYLGFSVDVSSRLTFHRVEPAEAKTESAAGLSLKSASAHREAARIGRPGAILLLKDMQDQDRQRYRELIGSKDFELFDGMEKAAKAGKKVGRRVK